MKLKFYLWLMGITGSISAWAWRKQAKIIKNNHQLQQEKIKREALIKHYKWKDML
tara:strand:+ start:523 stop:687 length:165 start_codon:yes stop_codon:yes gene_type:complete